MFLHTLLGGAISSFLWFVWIQHYFYTPQNKIDIADEVDKWISK